MFYVLIDVTRRLGTSLASVANNRGTFANKNDPTTPHILHMGVGRASVPPVASLLGPVYKLPVADPKGNGSVCAFLGNGWSAIAMLLATSSFVVAAVRIVACTASVGKRTVASGPGTTGRIFFCVRHCHFGTGLICDLVLPFIYSSPSLHIGSPLHHVTFNVCKKKGKKTRVKDGLCFINSRFIDTKHLLT